MNAQKKLVNDFLIDAKAKLKGLESGEIDKDTLFEGGLSLLRAFRGFPKSKALIKYLSEEGIRAQLQKVENFHLQDREREMPKADKELYFVINEKHNTIELTEKGIDLLSDGDDRDYFVMPDLGLQLN